MTLQQLRCFITTAKYQNFHDSAKYLFVSQPAVSHQIQQLEEELGVRLFERSRRSVTLTTAGKVFYADAIAIMDQIDLAVQRVRNEAEQKHLNIAVDETIDLPKLTEILARYHERYPDITVNLTTVHLMTDRILKESADIDIAFAADIVFQDQTDITLTALNSSPIYCVMPTDHKYAGYDRLNFELLKGEPLIFYDNAHCPPWLRQIVHTIIHENPDCEFCYSGSFLQMLSMIRAGLGISVMPSFAVSDSTNLVFVPMEHFEPARLVAAYSDNRVNDSIRSFLRIAEQVFRD